MGMWLVQVGQGAAVAVGGALDGVRGERDPVQAFTRRSGEPATLTGFHWHNTERLHGYLNDVPPAEFEATFYAPNWTDRPRSESNSPSLHQTQGDS